MPSAYVASTITNAQRVQGIQALLRSMGFTITYDWTEHGSVMLETADIMQRVAQAEINGVLSADVLVVVLPGGKGTHVELGMALAHNKPVFILGEPGLMRDSVFYWSPKVNWCIHDLILMATLRETGVIA